jgi:hypothetical protein
MDFRIIIIDLFKTIILNQNMKKKYFTIIGLSGLLLITMSCKNKVENNAEPETERVVAIETVPAVAVSDNRPMSDIVKTASASYTAEGPLIRGAKIPVKLVVEYDKEGRMVKESTGSCQGGAACMKLVFHYDTLGKIAILESYEGNRLVGWQETKYNKREDIITEHKLEVNEESIDTFLFEYHHTYQGKNRPTITYRTNNKDTVTQMTVLKKGNKTFTTEKVYPERSMIITTVEEITHNNKNLPIEIKSTTIASGWSDKSKLDTLVSLEAVVYNKDGQRIEEIFKEKGEVIKHIKSFYEFGAIKRKEITRGSVQYTIDFKHTFWPEEEIEGKN